MKLGDKELALNPLPLEDPKGGAKSLTRVSGIGVAIVAVLIAVNDSWATIFDPSTPVWAKPIFLMVVVAAWAIIASADLLSRGYAKAHEHTAGAAKDGHQLAADASKDVARARADADREVAKARADAEKGADRVITMPRIDAVDRREDDLACVVTAARVSGATPDDPVFLVMREDGTTRWAPKGDLKFGIPTSKANGGKSRTPSGGKSKNL